MSFINYALKEIHCKIIYFGAGMGGKTTNVQYIYEHTQNEPKSQLMTIGSENERTLFFDFLPLTIGKIGDFNVRFHLYSIPGQTFYETSPDFILKGVDGIVFVVDSLEERMEANIEAFETLSTRLKRHGYDMDRVPFVFQYNKRDMPGAVSVQELQTTFNPKNKIYFEAISNRGVGVMETLQGVCELVIKGLKGSSDN